MRVQLFLVGLARGEQSKLDRSWLVEYDPAQFSDDPDLICLLRTSRDRSRARSFETSSEAVEYYRQEHGLRRDARPNRPLTAYTVEVVPINDEPVAAGVQL